MCRNDPEFGGRLFFKKIVTFSKKIAEFLAIVGLCLLVCILFAFGYRIPDVRTKSISSRFV